LWDVLALELKQFDILPKNFPTGSHPERVRNELIDWLNADDKQLHQSGKKSKHARRILLLLDEADAFLAKDGSAGSSAFANTARLKGIMEDTDRRFKVVFAGLHNVQRTTALANQPLAHFGDPICIGPLFANGEWKEALALAEQPLRASGYQFQNRVLVWRILSQVNYYPSLIQLYGRRLFEHLQQQVHWDQTATPPFIVSEQHVNDAYQSRELRDQIRERFRWTLDLDVRYKVIALSIAYQTHLSESAAAAGFDIGQIRQEATYWQGTAFEGLAVDQFRALVEEMVGLGILRVVGSDRYALRGSNVALLIGSKAEIEERLVGLTIDAAGYQVDPGLNRRGLRTVHDPHSKLCPLTTRQEFELQRPGATVSIIHGVKAAASDDLPAFITEWAEPGYFRRVDGSITTPAQFGAWLNGVLTEAVAGNTTCLVPPAVAWSEQWVEAAASMLRSAQRKTRLVRMVFIADAGTTWRLVRHWEPLNEKLAELGIAQFGLQPWARTIAHRWLDGLGFPVADASAEINEVEALTGLWPVFLYSLLGEPAGHPSLSRLKKRLEEYRVAQQAFVSSEQYQELLGLDVDEPARVIRKLAEVGEADPSELVHWLDDGTSLDVVNQALSWANLLGLASETTNNSWRAKVSIQV
jgi:hypothetical protein